MTLFCGSLNVHENYVICNVPAIITNVDSMQFLNIIVTPQTQNLSSAHDNGRTPNKTYLPICARPQ